MALAIAPLAMMPRAAHAEPVKLIFATTSSPDIALVQKVFDPWAAKVNAESGGTLDIDVRNGSTIANATNYYDRVVNNVVQIAFGMEGLIGNRFPLSAAAGLPYVIDPNDAVAASVALWRLYKSGAMDAEYGDLKPVMLAVLPPSFLHFVKPPASIEETRGLKLIVSGKERSELVERLGYAPISGPTADMYSMLQRGAAAGVVGAWPSFTTFKLQEVTLYHLEVPLGSSTSIVFMTEKRFASLPQAARKAIDDNATEAQSRHFGEVWQATADDARATTAKMPGQVFGQLDPATAQKWQSEAEKVLDEWSQATPGGKEVLTKFRAMLADVKAGK
jgi:TRAP-type C4-dicarboxylate transport system substrate-binding protein